jgi:hypothetical protein
MMSCGNIRYNCLRLSSSLQIAILIGKPNYAVAVGDIDPLWIIAQWIEGDAIGLKEA